jgi:hypothetical protein
VKRRAFGACAILTVLALGVSAFTGLAPGPFLAADSAFAEAPAAPAPLEPLDLDTLRAAFNRDAGIVRVVAILSPT